MGVFHILAFALLAGNAIAEVPHWKMGKDTLEKLDELGKQSKTVMTRWHKGHSKIPYHIRNKTLPEVFSAIPVNQLGGCGSTVKLSTLGIQRSQAAANAWKDVSLLATQSLLRRKSAEHPGRDSFAIPGAGSKQTIKDEGRSVMGSLKDGRKTVDPYATVQKDGFFEVGCFHDAMLTFGDKYGNDADKYRMQYTDVSIVLYDELVLQEKKQPMTPVVCFEFCRTIPDMGFFGIADGRTCYCTPYYKPQPGDDETCNAGCAGNPSVMCGNMKGKSSIFGMHLCDSTAEALGHTLRDAKEGLDYYMEASLLALDLGKKMAASGLALEKVGGLSGAPGAAANGMTAKKKSKDLTQAFMPATGSYAKLLKAYKLGKAQVGQDFSDSTELIAADHAMADMKATVGAVVSGAAAAHDAVKLAFPVVDPVCFGDDVDGGDAAAVGVQKLMDGEDRESDFRSGPYAFGNTVYEAPQSSCTGPVIDSPMIGLGQAGCAAACEATVYPKQCVAYSFYTLTDADDLCFLLEDIHRLETFKCPEALLQTRKASADPASAFCGVKMSAMATGYRSKGEWKKTSRCFGGDSAVALKQTVTEYAVPGDSSLVLGAVTLEKAL